LISNWEQVKDKSWVQKLIDWEEAERAQRSLQRRISSSKVKRFKPMADFDWKWPSKIDRDLVEDLFNFRFIEEKANVILIGPNGTGKTMIAKNLVHQSVMNGNTATFVNAAEMLGELMQQDTSYSLQRRNKKYSRPDLLAIDEVGYLSYDSRHADLLFEVINRRYTEKPTIITTNKTFREWNEVFPNASCVVAMIDRLVHRSEVVDISGKSYRLKEAEERKAMRTKKRMANKKKSKRK